MILISLPPGSEHGVKKYLDRSRLDKKMLDKIKNKE